MEKAAESKDEETAAANHPKESGDFLQTMSRFMKGLRLGSRKHSQRSKDARKNVDDQNKQHGEASTSTISKCSNCDQFLTCKESFDSHICRETKGSENPYLPFPDTCRDTNDEGAAEPVDMVERLVGKIKLNCKATTLVLTDSDIVDEAVLSGVLRKHTNPKVVKKIILRGKRHLKSLSPIIGMFENLTLLDLSQNGISELPWSIGRLKNLQSLDLSDNSLMLLPKAIQFCSSLTMLNVESNCLTTLPTELLELRNLKILKTEGNVRLPPNLCQNDVQKTFSALQKRSLRHNLWENVCPWIGEDIRPTIKTLWELSMDAVITNKIDFLCVVNVPPVIQQHLKEMVIAETKKIDLAKCSKCHQYFSCEEKFHNHNCEDGQLG